MTYVVTVQIDTDPGQEDNHSVPGITWDLPVFNSVGYPGIGQMVVTADQIPIIAQGFASAYQESVRVNNNLPNATVTLTSVVDSEMVEQDNTLYPTGG
jgi:hypothetical protein